MSMGIYLFFISYQIVQIIALPFVCVYLLVRKFKKKPVFGNFAQRCGLLVPVPDKNRTVVWIHAVSVGEVLATERLINQIKQEWPGSVCYVTTGTLQGKKMAEQHLKADYISFIPYDFLIPLCIAFKRINPKVIMIMEAELWPNLLMLAHFKKIPLYSLNARFNATSLKKRWLVKSFLAFLNGLFDHIFVQSVKDQKAFEALLIPQEKISVLGNIKAFNVQAKKEATLKEAKLMPEMYRQKRMIEVDHQQFGHPFILLVGSVHPGELDVYLELFKQLKQKHQKIKMILAPRHFHWKKELIEKVQASGFSPFLWDESVSVGTQVLDVWEKIVHQVFKQADILIMCTLGTLFNLYPLADIFYLGGTFVPVGGHNLLEPAVWAVPSFVGPYYRNCKEIADQLEFVHALLKVKTGDELFEKTNFLLNNSQEITKMSKNTENWFTQEVAFVTAQLNEKLFNKLLL